MVHADAAQGLFGTGTQKWAFTVFGTIQADYITDTTRSYNDYIGQQVVARTDTLEGKEGRTQFGMRNTRIGFLLDSPAIGNTVPSAVFQMDFAGNQPSVPFVPPGSPGSAGISESAYYNSPTARVRHAYVTLRNPVVDILAGQTFDVFGWQNYYAPCALLGLPNQVSSRTAQFRLSRSFGAGGPVVVDVALAAARPGQRDSQIPDIEGGVRLSLPGWKGITTPGNAVTIAAPFSIGVSGITRQFKVNAFTPPPAQTFNRLTGWGVSGDIFIPVIPARSVHDRGNRLTLVGSFVWSTGIADLIVAGGGARFPTLPNPQQQSPPPAVHAERRQQPGHVRSAAACCTRSTGGPPRGRSSTTSPARDASIVSGNFTYAHSRNISQAVPEGRRRDRAAGQRRRFVAVGRRQPAVRRDAGDSLRPRRPVHLGPLPRWQQAPQHPRDFPGALHVLGTPARSGGSAAISGRGGRLGLPPC